MENLLTKKNTLFVALLGCFPLMVLWLLKDYEHKSIFLDFFIFLPLLILSIISFIVNDQAFNSWLHFASWFLPISFLLVLLTPISDSSLFPINKPRVALLLSGTFLITGLLIIFVKSKNSRIS